LTIDRKPSEGFLSKMSKCQSVFNVQSKNLRKVSESSPLPNPLSAEVVVRFVIFFSPLYGCPPEACGHDDSFISSFPNAFLSEIQTVPLPTAKNRILAALFKEWVLA